MPEQPTNCAKWLIMDIKMIDHLIIYPWSERQVFIELRKTDFAEISKLPLPNVPVYFFVGGNFEVPPDQRDKDFDQELFLPYQCSTLLLSTSI